MVVRGAPAIAIVVALSLAVEVSNLNEFDGSSKDTAPFLLDKLEYLVSSRPTAVNLSDAASKPKEIINKAAATVSESKSVFQAYIEAAGIGLEDDVASNKSVAATAGYGTSLGVIRAVNAEGFLDRAYCTETRPFNQGSRLTAFELVHDNIPAALIADSAAVALMKVGPLNSLIVGADRVAANGDLCLNVSIQAEAHQGCVLDMDLGGIKVAAL